jgi:hypothetical protein
MKDRKHMYFAYRSFWPEPEAHQRFDALGTDTVCFFAANTTNSLGEPYCLYPPTWVADGTYQPAGVYDFAPADQQINDLKRDCPHADFICMVDLNTPPWLHWLFRCDTMTQLGRLCSDPEWRRVTSDYMRAFLSHTETTHGDRIVAYVLSGGATSEWYDHSGLAESPSRLAAWHQELQGAGLPPTEIPGLAARNHVSFDHLLRDPQQDGEALRYLRFCARQVTDTIRFFLREARTVIRPQVALGVFYAYSLLACGERVILGNNECEELLQAPELDFVISPNGGFSNIGDGGGDLGSTESVQLAGKNYLRECDQKTHCFNRQLSKYVRGPWPAAWKTEAETLAGIKRELAYSLIKRCPLWWFDMWGGFYEPPAVMALLEKSCKLYREHIDAPVDRVAETVLLVDTESIYYLDQNEEQRTHWFYPDTKRALDRIGAPWECYCFSDLPNLPDPERFKLWLLPGIFELTPEKRALLDRYVRLPGRTAVYLYAPGISDGHTLDTERVLELTGTPFGTPGLTVTTTDGHRSAYFGQGPDLTPAVLKELAASAGVHLYSDHEQPVYANSRLLAVHTAEGGVQQVRLPRPSPEVRELFSDALVATDCTTFEYEFATPDTALFSW